jgi:hypothetical protein
MRMTTLCFNHYARKQKLHIPSNVSIVSGYVACDGAKLSG